MRRDILLILSYNTNIFAFTKIVLKQRSLPILNNKLKLSKNTYSNKHNRIFIVKQSTSFEFTDKTFSKQQLVLLELSLQIASDSLEIDLLLWF